MPTESELWDGKKAPAINVLRDKTGDAVVGDQGAVIADCAAATAAVVGDTVSTTAGYGPLAEADADAIHVAIDASIVDLAAVVVKVDLILARLRAHGIIDT